MSRKPGDQLFRYRPARRMIKVAEDAKLKKYQIEARPDGTLVLAVGETAAPTNDATGENPWLKDIK